MKAITSHTTKVGDLVFARGFKGGLLQSGVVVRCKSRKRVRIEFHGGRGRAFRRYQEVYPLNEVLTQIGSNPRATVELVSAGVLL